MLPSCMDVFAVYMQILDIRVYTFDLCRLQSNVPLQMSYISYT
jgi:hypothetical protein